jgi:hypothetical protein
LLSNQDSVGIGYGSVIHHQSEEKQAAHGAGSISDESRQACSLKRADTYR